MSHAMTVILDNTLRKWNSKEQFPLSEGLKASARLKNHCVRHLRLDRKSYHPKPGAGQMRMF